MSEGLQRLIDLTVLVSVFGLVLAVWMVFVLISLRHRTKKSEAIQRRLEVPGAGSAGTRVLRLWHDGQETTTTVLDEQPSLTPLQRLENLTRSAGWKSPAHTIITAVLGMMVLCSAVVLVLSSSLPGALAAAVAVGVIFWMVLNVSIRKQAALFERQFIEAIGLACRSLRAGHPLTGAFRLISEEIPSPVGQTFQEIVQQQALGVSLETAIRNVAADSNSHDLKMFATSVVMQLRSGGNLADMMDRLAAVIRDRIRLNRRVNVLTAQTQLSKRVLLLLPVIVFALINILSGSYMQPLYTTIAGKIMMAIGGAMMLFGWWVMNQIAKFRY